jgi:hypothetical protein
MSVSLLRQYIRETVIDASKKFADRRTQNFRQKMQKLANDIPNVFARQEKQEKEINSRLNNLRTIVNRLVNQKRGRLAVPGAFSDGHWGPEASFLNIIAYSSERDDYYPELKRFVRSNAAAFERASNSLKAELAQIENDADELEWPAPWRRYTNWAYIVRLVKDFDEKLHKLLHQ